MYVKILFVFWIVDLIIFKLNGKVVIYMLFVFKCVYCVWILKVLDGLIIIVILFLIVIDLFFLLVEWYLNICVNLLIVVCGLVNVSVFCFFFFG